MRRTYLTGLVTCSNKVMGHSFLSISAMKPHPNFSEAAIMESDCKSFPVMFFTRADVRNFLLKTIEETVMQWTKPAFSDLRFGFEITMYIANR